MSQTTDLIRLLRRGWVTPLDALNKAQCLSYHRRLSDIRQLGHKTEARWIELPNGKRVKAWRIKL
jgi:hypothetical protein